jgi:hypothetical protein
MSAPTTFGVTSPDERQVALLVWLRNADGTRSLATIDDVNRKYAIVPEEENEEFEKEATRLGWGYTLVGYDGCFARRTYSIDRLPPQEFKALDLTKSKDVLMLHSKITRDKRFRTKTLIQKAEKAIDKAMGVAMGKMEDPHQEVRGAELAERLAKTVVAMEGMNQTDEHQDEKNARLDAGLSTENTNVKLWGVSQKDMEGF